MWLFVGVHVGGVIHPFGAVHRLANFFQAAREIEFRSRIVFRRRRCGLISTRVVAPLGPYSRFSVAKASELGGGLLTRFWPHPREGSANRRAARQSGCANPFERAGLCFGGNLFAHRPVKSLARARVIGLPAALPRGWISFGRLCASCRENQNLGRRFFGDSVCRLHSPDAHAGRFSSPRWELPANCASGP